MSELDKKWSDLCLSSTSSKKEKKADILRDRKGAVKEWMRKKVEEKSNFKQTDL